MLKVSGGTSMYMYRPDQANVNAISNCGKYLHCATFSEFCPVGPGLPVNRSPLFP